MLERVFGDNSPSKQKRLWLITCFVFGFFIIFLGYAVYEYKEAIFGSFFYQVNRQPAKEAENKAAECLNCVRRNIDGIFVEPGKENLYPIAVIIENLLEARPQAGLSRASLVYEAEAEGNITRFLTIFDSGVDIERIGPVRSARPYFIDWTAELSALFTHCGGSPQALAKIAKENIFDLNEFYQGGFFWRSGEREAPHNIYTSSDNLKKYLELKNRRNGNFFSWQFKDDILISERPEKSEIIVNFPLPDYVVKWEYDKENNDYVRYLAGQVHKDANGEEIRAKNIIIEYVKAQVIDDVLRLKMENTGEGKAVVCMDGKCEEGEWQKKTNQTRTRFYTSVGSAQDAGQVAQQEFKFNAGPTWIEVVRPEYKVDYK